MPCCRSSSALPDRPCNVFRLAGYRGDPHQYHVLTPIINAEGKLLDAADRKFYATGDVNRWREPRCECHAEQKKKSCKVCEKPSVFGLHISKIPTNADQVEAWRRDHYERNKGAFYLIYEKDGKPVRITEEYLHSRRCGILSRVEKVSVPEEVETACKEDDNRHLTTSATGEASEGAVVHKQSNETDFRESLRSSRSKYSDENN